MPLTNLEQESLDTLLLVRDYLVVGKTTKRDYLFLMSNVRDTIYRLTAKKLDKRGFTLIELMIVITVIALLGAIIVPKLTSAIGRSKDAATRGNLGTLRSALSIYYIDTGGSYPGFPTPFSQPAGYGTLLHDTLVPRYLAKIPNATPSGNHHPASNEVYLVWNLSGNQDNEPTSGRGWIYDANPFDNLKPDEVKGLFGTIRVLCRHTDTKGNLWNFQ